MEELYSQISNILINTFLIPFLKKGGESLANEMGDNLYGKLKPFIQKLRINLEMTMILKLLKDL